MDKNASTTNPRSYVWTGEYEIFEFDLGSTFNYAEMAALIAPRPFMVERGHFDGVADDWTVGWEFAKVRFLYLARLKMATDARSSGSTGRTRSTAAGRMSFCTGICGGPHREAVTRGLALPAGSRSRPRVYR